MLRTMPRSGMEHVAPTELDIRIGDAVYKYSAPLELAQFLSRYASVASVCY
jgi:hypothetical protein